MLYGLFHYAIDRIGFNKKMKFVYTSVCLLFVIKDFPSFSHEIKDKYRLNRCMVTGGR